MTCIYARVTAVVCAFQVCLWGPKADNCFWKLILAGQHLKVQFKAKNNLGFCSYFVSQKILVAEGVQLYLTGKDTCHILVVEVNAEISNFSILFALLITCGKLLYFPVLNSCLVSLATVSLISVISNLQRNWTCTDFVFICATISNINVQCHMLTGDERYTLLNTSWLEADTASF